MKKIIAIFVLAACVFLFSCNGTTVLKDEDISSANSYSPSMFIELERASSWRVVYHCTTKVMYVVSNGGYNAGTFVVLVNADGTPMVYDD